MKVVLIFLFALLSIQNSLQAPALIPSMQDETMTMMKELTESLKEFLDKFKVEIFDVFGKLNKLTQKFASRSLIISSLEQIQAYANQKCQDRTDMEQIINQSRTVLTPCTNDFNNAVEEMWKKMIKHVVDFYDRLLNMLNDCETAQCMQGLKMRFMTEIRNYILTTQEIARDAQMQMLTHTGIECQVDKVEEMKAKIDKMECSSTNSNLN